MVAPVPEVPVFPLCLVQSNLSLVACCQPQVFFSKSQLCARHAPKEKKRKREMCYIIEIYKFKIYFRTTLMIPNLVEWDPDYFKKYIKRKTDFCV